MPGLNIDGFIIKSKESKRYIDDVESCPLTEDEVAARTSELQLLQAVFFVIYYYLLLSLHIITFSQGYVGALRSNVNKTKHQIWIKHKFV